MSTHHALRITLFLGFIILFGVLAKSLDLPVIANNTNKLEYVLIIGLAVFCILVTRTKRLKPINSLLVIFIFFMIVLLASSFSKLNSYALVQVVLNAKFLFFLLLFCVLPITTRTIKAIESLFIALILINFAFIVVEILAPSIYNQIMQGAVTDTVIQGTSFKRYSGVFYHPGPMGVFCAMMFVLYSSKYIFLTKKSAKPYILTLVFLSLLLSGQRLELVSALFSILVIFTFSKNYKLGLTLLFGSIVIAIFIAIQTTSAQFVGYSSFEGLNQFQNARFVLYQSAVQLASTNFPLGNGAATFGSSMSINNPLAAYGSLGFHRLWWYEGESYLTDTYWAMVIAESGWLGTLLMGSFLLSLIYKLFIIAKHANFTVYSLNVAVSLMIFSFVISFATPIYSGASLPLLFISLYTAISINSSRNK